ncbi:MULTISPECIES: DUF3301 domain-containing protein [Vibrio]|uniref:DUF3301 domain-containing protein n=1 Tax=Vibrio TaxID=662 RepID=UPI001482B3D5|nr:MULTISPECIES: DUF3301 domain-containing protein [Vibrio]MDQ2165402.1 DUF3301 domain-containing protein [Vibrio anguillarum]NNN96806.1 DUF3301 domain-containing protein [Vibrio sp. B4-6]
MLGDLLAILLLSLGCFLFWQQRRQAELAKAAISRKCEQLDLQLISVAFGRHKFKTPEGLCRWHTVYWFEFSALGDDCYQGELQMIGFRPSAFHLPPHRM